MERKDINASFVNVNPLGISEVNKSTGKINAIKARNFNMSQKGKNLNNESVLIVDRPCIAEKQDQNLDSVNNFLTADYVSDDISDSTIFEILKNSENHSAVVQANNKKNEEKLKIPAPKAGIEILKNFENHSAVVQANNKKNEEKLKIPVPKAGIEIQARKNSIDGSKMNAKQEVKLEEEHKNDACMKKNIIPKYNPIPKRLPEKISKSPNPVSNIKKTPIKSIIPNQHKIKLDDSARLITPRNINQLPISKKKEPIARNPAINTNPPNFDINNFSYENLLKLDEDKYNQGNGYNANQLSRLISSSFAPRMINEECSICQETFETSQKIIYLNCLHYFHEKCIRNWLSRMKSCPVCKFEVEIN